MSGDNCLLCYRVCSSKKRTRRKRNVKISMLDEQLWVIFVLRKLLEIPKSFCENLLSQTGDPSGWIASCDCCAELIDSAHSTFKKLTYLQGKYEHLKSKIKTTLSNSTLKDSLRIDEEDGTTTDSIRNYVLKLKDLNSTDCVTKFDPDVIVKVERDNDIEEENYKLPVNYDEDFKVGRSKENNKYEILPNINEIAKNDTETSDKEDENAYQYYEKNEEDSDSDWEAEENANSKVSDTESNNSDNEGENKNVENNFENIIKEKKRTCEYCGKTFAKPSKLKAHVICRHTKNLPLKCEKCNISFKTGTGLKRHCATKHPDSDLSAVSLGKTMCEICGQSYSVDYMKTHMLVHSEGGKNKFSCEICQKGFDRSDLLKIHKRGEHYKELGLEPYECKECNKVFKSKKYLRGHNAVKHKKGVSISCSVCEAAFQNNSALQKHVERVHESAKFSCEVCGKRFNEKRKMDVHVMSAHTKHYECEICKRVFPRMDKLRIHQRGVHYAELNLEPYKCTICDQFFKSHVILRHHTIQKHTKEFSVFCSICNAGFFDNGNLSMHIRRVHDKEKNYTCSYCGMAFFFRQTFETHVISQHTKEYAATCEICGHGSATNHLHEKHMKTHDSKTFTCELCGDAFKLQYQLQEHQKGRHHEELGLDPFKCTQCGKICNSRSTLRFHVIRQHTKASNFPCTECDKTFLSNQRLRDHNRRHHTGEKPYKCPVCNEGFFTKKQKERHAEKHSDRYKCSICSMQLDDAWQLSLHLGTHGINDNVPPHLLPIN